MRLVIRTKRKPGCPGERINEYLIDGKVVTEKEWDAANGTSRRRRVKKGKPGASLIGWKPLHDESLAVHTSQIEEATKAAAAAGVPTEFDSIGAPILRSREHRNAFLKYQNCFDRSAGYGDRTKQN